MLSVMRYIGAAKWARGTFTGILVRSRPHFGTDSHPGLRISPDSEHQQPPLPACMTMLDWINLRSLWLAIRELMLQDQTRRRPPLRWVVCRRKEDGEIRQVPLFTGGQGA